MKVSDLKIGDRLTKRGEGYTVMEITWTYCGSTERIPLAMVRRDGAKRSTRVYDDDLDNYARI